MWAALTSSKLQGCRVQRAKVQVERTYNVQSERTLRLLLLRGQVSRCASSASSCLWFSSPKPRRHVRPRFAQQLLQPLDDLQVAGPLASARSLWRTQLIVHLE